MKGTSCARCVCMFMFNELRFRLLARVLALSPSIGPAQSNPGRLFLGLFRGRRQLVVGLPAQPAGGGESRGSRRSSIWQQSALEFLGSLRLVALAGYLREKIRNPNASVS